MMKIGEPIQSPFWPNFGGLPDEIHGFGVKECVEKDKLMDLEIFTLFSDGIWPWFSATPRIGTLAFREEKEEENGWSASFFSGCFKEETDPLYRELSRWWKLENFDSYMHYKKFDY